MTEGMTITCKWRDKPIDVLRQIVTARTKLMKDTTEDATIATAINALVSIRAATTVAKTQHIKDSDIQVKDVTGSYVPGWSSNTGKRRRVLRIGGRHGAYLSGTPKNLMGGIGAVRNLYGSYQKGEQPRAFWASYRPPWEMVQGMQGGRVVQSKIGYFIARSESEVREWLKQRVVRHVRQYAKLARNAISVAMGKIGRAMPLDGGAKARVNASKLAEVDVKKGGDRTYVRFLDGLDYSLSAVKGGAQGVELALMKACNKMAGRLARFANDSWGHDGGVTTPFPEVAR